MPVIDDPKPAIQALTTGEVDVNPPYQAEEGPEDEEVVANEAVESEEVILERWSRLAGLHLLK